MSQILTYLTNNLQHYYPAIITFVVSGGAVSALTQVTKKIKAWGKDSTIQKFVLLISFLGTVSEWYLQNYSTHFSHAVTPFIWFPAVTAALFTLATFVHHFPIKQLEAFLSKNPLSSYSQLKKDAELYRVEQAAQAAAPKTDQFV